MAAAAYRTHSLPVVERPVKGTEEGMTEVGA